MKHPLLPLAALLLLALAPLAHAQQKGGDDDKPTVNPYRPTVTDPASLTFPGFLEMEVGGAPSHGGEQARRAFSTPIVLKLTAPSKRLEYHVFLGGYSQQTSPDGAHLSGRGDVTPGLQYLLLAQSPHTYDIAARVEYKIPTAKQGIGTGKTDYDLLLLASKDYNKTLHGDFNLGVYQQGRMSGQGFATQYLASGVLNTKLSKTLTLQDELYGYSGNSEGGTIVSTLHAIGYQPSRVLAFDAGVDIGISHAAPRYTLLFGSTFFVGHLF